MLCGLMGLTKAQAADRFAQINVDLAASEQASIAVGLAELDGDDRVEDLVGRADAAMYQEREAAGSRRPAKGRVKAAK